MNVLVSPVNCQADFQQQSDNSAQAKSRIQQKQAEGLRNKLFHLNPQRPIARQRGTKSKLHENQQYLRVKNNDKEDTIKQKINKLTQNIVATKQQIVQEITSINQYANSGMRVKVKEAGQMQKRLFEQHDPCRVYRRRGIQESRQSPKMNIFRVQQAEQRHKKRMAHKRVFEPKQQAGRQQQSTKKLNKKVGQQQIDIERDFGSRQSLAQRKHNFNLKAQIIPEKHWQEIENLYIQKIKQRLNMKHNHVRKQEKLQQKWGVDLNMIHETGRNRYNSLINVNQKRQKKYKERMLRNIQNKGEQPKKRNVGLGNVSHQKQVILQPTNKASEKLQKAHKSQPNLRLPPTQTHTNVSLLRIKNESSQSMGNKPRNKTNYPLI